MAGRAQLGHPIHASACLCHSTEYHNAYMQSANLAFAALAKICATRTYTKRVVVAI